MISVEEARRILLTNLPEGKTEQVPFTSALGRILAENLFATSNIPRFDRAAVDGYALLSSDAEKTPVELSIRGISRAGGGMPESIRPGEAMAIMTGAPVPEGADSVQMIEKCRVLESEGKVVILQTVRNLENIALKGAEAKIGDITLAAGQYIGPSEIAVMASFGFLSVNVYKKPSIALFATGDELVEFDQTPRPDQIRNSNSHCILSQLSYMGIDADYLGIAEDNKNSLREKMIAGLQRDVLIITGGVSMGEYDLVKDVFEELEIEILFSKVSIKPGKPSVFGRKGNCLIFGLPGNPISSFVTFETFARPAIGRLCGMKHPELPCMRGELTAEMRQSPGRTAYMPAWASWDDDRWKVEPLHWKSSADIIGFTRANAVFVFPKELDHLVKGEKVELLLLPDHFLRQR